MPAAPSSRAAATKAASGSLLSRISTLRRSSDFTAVLRVGRRRRSGPVEVVRARGFDGQVRVGLVVGKKVGTAVLRNRIRRRLRQAILGADLVPGYDYVIIANRQAAEVPFQKLVEVLGEAVR